jgi:hypothetical protein
MFKCNLKIIYEMNLLISNYCLLKITWIIIILWDTFMKKILSEVLFPNIYYHPKFMNFILFDDEKKLKRIQWSNFVSYFQRIISFFVTLFRVNNILLFSHCKFIWFGFYWFCSKWFSWKSIFSCVLIFIEYLFFDLKNKYFVD